MITWDTILGFVVGAVVAIFAEPVRQWLLRPKLRLEFAGGRDYFTSTPEGSGEERHEAIYLRVRVTNKTRFIAKECRAYLINIEKKDEHGRFKRTIYADSMPLPWSGHKQHEAYDPVDIAKDVPHYFNIFATRSTSNEFSPLIMPVPYRYEELFKQTGTFRFTVQLSAHGIDPKTLKLPFEWQGVWDDFKVAGLKPEPNLKGNSHKDSRAP